MSTSTSTEPDAALKANIPHLLPHTCKPPARKPSDRLREKIHRDSCARMEGDKFSQKVETIGDGDEEMKMSVDDDDSANVASKDIEKKVKLPAASSRNKTEPDQPHTETTQRPGAFYVSGDEEPCDDTRDAPTVPSVMMEVDELPVAAELADDSDKYASVVEASKLDDVVVNYKSRKVQVGIFVLLAVIVGAIVGGVLGSKRSKDALVEQCIVEDPSKLGNGVCDGGEYNTEKCQWDHNDCLLINSYPNCSIDPAASAKLGDGICDGYPYFAPSCGLDGGDCSNCTVPPIWSGYFTVEDMGQMIGDGFCHGPLNHAGCGFDGGDCKRFNEKYPDCRIGDGTCASFNESFPGCVVHYPEWLSDGECDAMGYNNVRCQYDGDDCKRKNRVFNRKYPDCLGGNHSCATFNATYPGCQVEDPAFLGDGECDGADYNTEGCLWDFGDCDAWNEMYPDCKRGDLSCSSWLKEYPDCDADRREWIGDGSCDAFGYNSTSCKYDGGDCLPAGNG